MQEQNIKVEALFFIASFVISIAFYHYFFSGYFLSTNLNFGGDYSYFLPVLLNGFYWFQSNGLFEVPWFTPAFCGGVPYLANPQNMYYSLPQFLTFLVDPVLSIYLTFIIFASLAYIGFYLLLRQIFALSREVSAFGAIAFLFNGFFLYRFFMGHLTFHSYALTPLIAYFLLHASANQEYIRKPRILIDTLMAGMLIAYVFHSGAANFVIPIILSVVGIWLLFALNGALQAKFWTQLFFAGLLAIGLSASKLTASIAFMDNFPRDFHPLPGIDGFWTALLAVFNTVFFSSTNEVGAQLVNTSFPIDNAEFEFGITIVPLMILLIYLFLTIRRWSEIRIGSVIDFKWNKMLLLILLTGLLLLPVILNTYIPSWNSILKSIPYIKSSSLLIRWIAIDLPLVILISSIALARIESCRLQYGLAVFGIMSIIFLNSGFYQDRHLVKTYNAGEVTKSYYAVKMHGTPPTIKNIGISVDQANRMIIPIGRNDSMMQGISHLLCYEPVFGYQTERLPIKKLHPGLVMDQHNGYLNIKNPACYLYGGLNRCTPGDHFRVAEEELAIAFVNYKPFPFVVSFAQKIANKVNIITLICVVLIMIMFIGYKIFCVYKKIIR